MERPAGLAAVPAVDAAPVFVIILNWNGWQDTLDCLRSVRNLEHPNVRAIVVDNGSEDDSVDRIGAWARAAGPDPVVRYDRAQAESGGTDAGERMARRAPLVLVETGQNLGFAGGCNVGLRYALAAGAPYVWLLNNDTVVEPDALGRLVTFLSENPACGAVTGQIRYYGSERVWNCGGDLTWYGSRRYHLGEAPLAGVPDGGSRQVTFMTACAALFRTGVVRKVGLLTERFFFGEEDYELALRFKRHGLKMACCYGAVIHHKVSSSINRGTAGQSIARHYLYYLNRFIDMRGYYPAPFWRLWRHASLAYILPMLRHSHGLSWASLLLLRKRLLADSATLDGVSRDRFELVSRRGLEAL